MFGADKSGVGPNSISLPKGPGSIEGLGESFQPTLNTGTANYQVALKLPPGTAGHTPELNLVYEGGGGNGPLGFGWSLPIHYVQRRSDHGIPTYGEGVGFPRSDTFINDMKEELVPQADGFSFCKNEGAFIRYQQASNYWIGVLPNGTRMEFGLTSEGRIQDSDNTNHIFSWLLQRETDTHGNVIAYSYTNFPGSNNLNQKYLSGISYGPGAQPWNDFHFVSFIYADRRDWFEDCRSGFVVRTGKRLASIVIGTQGPTLPGHLVGDFNQDGVADNLDRRYELSYLDYTNSFWSLLASILPVGADGVSTIPQSSFGYAVSNPADSVTASGKILGGMNEPNANLATGFSDFVDLNGDGLPDLLQTEGGIHIGYINEGQISSGGADVIKWRSAVEVEGELGQAEQFDLKSSAPVAHLADMDGDGLADFVVTALDGSVFYFANRGRLAWGTNQSMSIQDSSPPSPFGNANVRIADLDFDKNMDVIQSTSTGNGACDAYYTIWFNLGNGSYAASTNVPQSSGFMFSCPGVQIADFNGDRVPDIMRLDNQTLVVTAGLGYGQFANPVPVTIPDVVLDDTQVSNAKLVDINGDGLADLVIENAAPGELWYWLNLGNYTFSHLKRIIGIPRPDNPVVRWADLNGNGTTDLIYADYYSIPQIQTLDIGLLINGVTFPNSLTTISNGIGRVTLINYLPSTTFALADAASNRPWPDPMPFPVQVVSEVTNLDSLGHQYVTQFRYHNGYYDPGEKQFRGFASAEQIDLGDPTAPTLVTRSIFDTGRTYEAMKGKLLVLSAEQADGTLFWAQTNLWTIPPISLYTGTNGTNVAYAHPTGTIKSISELGQGTPRRLETEVAYDNYGNQTTNSDFGIVENGDRTAFNDERITVTEYAINTNAWILRTPKRIEIRDENGSVISRIESYYDDETFSGKTFGIVTIGNLTLNREWINPSNSTAFIQSARSKYDAYGNPISLFDPLADPSDAGKGHFRDIAYDSYFHTYPTTETIHIGNGSQALIFQAAYDQGFATVTSSLDFNTNLTTYGYDTFGRLINMVKPYDTPAYPTVEYDYALAQPFNATGVVNYVETRQLDRIPGSAGANKRDHYFISRDFVDGLGRKLLSKTEAEPETPGGPPRVVVNDAVQFNSRQKPSMSLNSYFSLLAGADLDSLLAYEDISSPGWQGRFSLNGQLLNLDLTSAHKTSIAYDATLREVVNTNQDDTFRRTVYEPLLTRSYDENQTDPASQYFGASMVHYNDGLGRLVQVDEVTHLNDDGTTSGGIKTWTTRYEYDLNNQLTKITDSQNNVKSMIYDGLKRKTFMDDPDRGHMTYNYDDASNLHETIDAKSQHILYTYDGANRILTEDYLDEGLPFSANKTYDPNLPISDSNRPDVAYFYDVPVPNLPQGDNTTATGHNTRGMLSYVWDLSGEEHTSYDARGRVEYVVKRIPDPVFWTNRAVAISPLWLVSYRTGFEYDSLDRTTRLTYPDNDEVTYQYNERTLLKCIPGGPNGNILSNLVYRPSGQQAQIDYGNGVRTTYDYDNRLRLNHLFTFRTFTSTNDPQLINFGYEFDGVSNIRQITDNRPSTAVPVGDKRRNTQIFAYDDLYRLTHAQYSFNLPGQLLRNDGSIDYFYDRIGNMLLQTSTINDADALTGLPIVNLGVMTSGGGSRFNRSGRAPADPPGPHALSQISNLHSAITNRSFSYDGNGNMLGIDGLDCTWDFKDRLVTCENPQMRADYTYDYADRRISKSVTYKPGSPNFTNNDPVINTLYVSKSFEIRDHDAPTKYVWTGHTRVAQITGSLSSRPRVQRFRFYSGWNLRSFAVTATAALAQFSDANPQLIVRAYIWSPANSNWTAVGVNETVASGSVLWINVSDHAMMSISGSYSEPTNRSIARGETFLPAAGLEVWSLDSALPASSVDWKQKEGTTRWQIGLQGALSGQSDLPSFLAPGEVLFLKADEEAQAQVPQSRSRVVYFHQDYLGSVNCSSDGEAGLVEESAYYPFGTTRSRLQLRSVEENYGYSQKEKDKESGLHNFEARLYDSGIARFIRCDNVVTFASASSLRILQNPQTLNSYANVANRPTTAIDPDGEFITQLVGGVAGAASEYAIQVALKRYEGKSWGESFKPNGGEWAAIGFSAAAGALTSGGSVGQTLMRAGKQFATEVGATIVGVGTQEGLQHMGVSEERAKVAGAVVKTALLLGDAVRHGINHGIHAYGNYREAGETAKLLSEAGAPQAGSAFKAAVADELAEAVGGPAAHFFSATGKFAAEAFNIVTESPRKEFIGSYSDIDYTGPEPRVTGRGEIWGDPENKSTWEARPDAGHD